MKCTQEQFIEKAIKKHGEFYDYSKLKYTISRAFVTIICPLHGDFTVQAGAHLRNGCKKCSDIKMSKTTDDFIVASKAIHGDKFDYSLTKYKNNNTQVTLLCKKHGEFKQLPCNHLRKTANFGCNQCLVEFNRSNTSEFIQKSKLIHGDTYSYDKVDYEIALKEVTITCVKHGDFHQKPNAHLNGHGCPFCRESSGEAAVKVYLDELNIRYEREKRFKSCRYKKPLPFDFYLPDFNILIEYHGIQHFGTVGNNFFGGETAFVSRQKRDVIKQNWAEENKYKLITIRYDEEISNKLNPFLKGK